MSEREEHPAATHTAFPYYFGETSTTEGTLTFAYSFPFYFSMEAYQNFPLEFPYSFGGAGVGTAEAYRGICFEEITVIIPPEAVPDKYKYRYDLAIFYGDLQNTYVEGRCSRWDTDNYNIIIGTWLKKDDLYNLKNNIRPGAIRELKRVIYSPKFYDSTWQGYNTLRFLPTPSSSEMNNSTLKKMRKNTIAYVKNITEHPIPSREDWVEIKLECTISGGTI